MTPRLFFVLTACLLAPPRPGVAAAASLPSPPPSARASVRGGAVPARAWEPRRRRAAGRRRPGTEGGASASASAVPSGRASARSPAGSPVAGGDAPASRGHGSPAPPTYARPSDSPPSNAPPSDARPSRSQPSYYIDDASYPTDPAASPPAASPHSSPSRSQPSYYIDDASYPAASPPSAPSWTNYLSPTNPASVPQSSPAASPPSTYSERYPSSSWRIQQTWASVTFDALAAPLAGDDVATFEAATLRFLRGALRPSADVRVTAASLVRQRLTGARRRTEEGAASSLQGLLRVEGLATGADADFAGDVAAALDGQYGAYLCVLQEYLPDLFAGGGSSCAAYLEEANTRGETSRHATILGLVLLVLFALAAVVAVSFSVRHGRADRDRFPLLAGQTGRARKYAPPPLPARGILGIATRSSARKVGKNVTWADGDGPPSRGRDETDSNSSGSHRADDAMVAAVSFDVDDWGPPRPEGTVV